MSAGSQESEMGNGLEQEKRLAALFIPAMPACPISRSSRFVFDNKGFQ